MKHTESRGATIKISGPDFLVEELIDAVHEVMHVVYMSRLMPADGDESHVYLNIKGVRYDNE